MEDAAPQETQETEQPAEVVIEEPQASSEPDNLEGFTPIDLSADMTELIKAAEEAAAKQVAEEVSDAVADDDQTTAEKKEEEVDCQATADAYLAQIDAMQMDLDNVEALTTSMAESLAQIDPNMETGDEGKAFIRRMYKVKKQKTESKVAKMPDTPLQCVKEVAGKVIMVENLQDDIDEAVSFRDFFANVYCQAYVNSLVTMRDGLS